MTEDQKAILFYKAAMLKKRPEYVPYKVSILSDVRSDLPVINMAARGRVVRQGEHECVSNQFGAISVKAENGILLAIKPNEYEPISWIENPHLQDTLNTN